MTQPLPGSTSREPATTVWASDDWRHAALKWVDAQLAERRQKRTPRIPPQPRLRPWSTLLVIDTEDGARYWFKAGLPELAPEGEILRWLGKVAPDAIARPIAIDHENRWSLTPDLGRSMRDAGHGSDISTLSSLLRSYARLQRASIGVTAQLADAGVSTLTPQDVARQIRAMRVPAEIAQRVRDAARRLEDVGLPHTIQHGDLHPGNVFITNPAPASFSAIIADWNDASIGNPLASLLAPLRQIRAALPGAEGEKAAERLMRAYLSTWSEHARSSALKAAVPDALLIARSTELIIWRKALARATHDERVQWGRHGTRTLQEMA